ncbi:hypothetical protein G7072_02615 [Nocardioides sp. HDW12B]|uniref:O-antigen ligase family protein n=1 Tax=Nocardioides sp. HDW12B TaxID=2714939 RepID=UPI00140E47D5|nr:O-antigen ligase family protein [Nocardioides sp. HDW12B]QIK65378.1 hypothetical protein G7072_02615 [Nocardioides sp. HDW12B]
MQQEVGLDASATSGEVRRHRLGVALVWTATAWTVLPRVLQSVTAPKVRGEVGVQSAVTGNLASSLSSTALALALLGLCCFIVLDSFASPRRAPVFRLMAVLAPWAYVAVRDLFVAEAPRVDLLVHTAVMLAIWRLHPDRRMLVALGYAVGASAALAVLMGVVVPGSAVFSTEIGGQITDDKAVFSLGLLAGFFSHSNTLGQMLALGLPVVLLIPKRGWRLGALAVLLLALLWTASRTAWIGVAVSVVVVTVLLPLPAPLRRMAAATAMAGAVSVAALVPLLVRDPSAFTSRGIVWITTREAFGVSPVFGRGSNWFEVVGSTSERLGVAASTAHSQLLHMMVTGGLVLVLLTLPMLAMVVAGALRHLREGSVWGVVYVIALAGCGTTEVVIKFGSVAAAFPVVMIPLGVLLFGEEAAPPLASPDVGADDRGHVLSSGGR